jgi:hypothetical protein
MPRFARACASLTPCARALPQLAAAVRADGFNASDTSALLCSKLSTACRGPQVRARNCLRCIVIVVVIMRSVCVFMRLT